MSEVKHRELEPTSIGEERIKVQELMSYKEKLTPGWQLVKEKYLEKEYDFKDFQQALDFVNKVGELAESMDHHPEIILSWGKVKITIWTHSVGGLSPADFTFATSVDLLSR